MQIRRLSKSDASILQECRLHGLSESPDAFLASYADIEGTPLSEVERDLTDPDILYLGAFDHANLVGIIRFVRPNRRSRRHTAEVRSVYVRSSHRGQGVARGLLSCLIEEARRLGLQSLTLSVLASNEPARHLYESLGFSVYGREPKAIKKGHEYIDQLHLWLDLAAT
jgi:ribosomal protein S18 acetylase RimI-like enzyme